ncbi:hypothetical protein FHP25_26880 [Vineibacter terrae]|uniref:Uncharacterized protein n=1 Tax=Vineibacter terrae TaxID=2586908 RepID=A0A5C8PFI0_9HYPH|nr:hypothetical protein [Vineibacter terrae]TXL72054.1 hypothetical protein FHP25_26880 [Vineibacter terrae]
MARSKRIEVLLACPHAVVEGETVHITAPCRHARRRRSDDSEDVGVMIWGDVEGACSRASVVPRRSAMVAPRRSSGDAYGLIDMELADQRACDLMWKGNAGGAAVGA